MLEYCRFTERHKNERKSHEGVGAGQFYSLQDQNPRDRDDSIEKQRGTQQGKKIGVRRRCSGKSSGGGLEQELADAEREGAIVAAR